MFGRILDTLEAARRKAKKIDFEFSAVEGVGLGEIGAAARARLARQAAERIVLIGGVQTERPGVVRETDLGPVARLVVIVTCPSFSNFQLYLCSVLPILEDLARTLETLEHEQQPDDPPPWALSTFSPE